MFKTARELKKFNSLPKDQRGIVFFSEGKSYWNTFKPVTDELIQRQIPFVFLSMDAADPGLSISAPGVSGFCVGKGSGFVYFMSMLNAGVVVMTTPGLQTLTLKRSRGVAHYAHLVHSPTGLSFYRRFSFDYFDSVLCSGPHQMKEMRQLELLRGARQKALYETGLVYMDVLKEQFTESAHSKTNTVLLAPTWGPNGALSRHGIKLIEAVLAGNFNLIVRPHPQQMRSEAALLKSLQRSAPETVRWDMDVSASRSMADSDIMISDLSGVIFDYAFLYEKPVITFDYPLKQEGFEQQDLQGPVWEKEISRQLGGVVSGEELQNLPGTIESLVRDESGREHIRSLRDQYLFNFGTAGKTAAGQILEISRQLKPA